MSEKKNPLNQQAGTEERKDVPAAALEKEKQKEEEKEEFEEQYSEDSGAVEDAQASISEDLDNLTEDSSDSI